MADEVLFSITACTFVPMPPLIVVVPDPVPELVIEPAMLIGEVEIVKPPLPLALRVRFPVPVTPPEMVAKVVELFQLWVAPRITGALRVRAPAPLFTVMPVAGSVGETVSELRFAVFVVPAMPTAPLPLSKV